MTKSKTKTGIVAGCYNCKHSDCDKPDIMDLSKIFCTKTKKVHKFNYSCKKWRIME